MIPAYTHLHDRLPKEVSGLKAEWTKEGYLLHWKAEQSDTNPELARYFVVYCFKAGEKADITNPANIVTITNKTFYLLPYEKGNDKYKYVVTAVDRFHNESKKGKTKKVKL